MLYPPDGFAPPAGRRGEGAQGLHGADEEDGGGAPDEDALHDGHLLLAVRVLQGLVVAVETPAHIILVGHNPVCCSQYL